MNDFERRIAKTPCLQSIDTLITMMNQIVVQFVMDHSQSTQSVSMVMCEKVVLGYCALNHLLLLLRSKNKRLVIPFADRMIESFINKSTHKQQCRDLGKFLIWLMLSSKYQWNDVAHLFIEEVFTRNVRWMIADSKYRHFDTTSHIKSRLQGTFNASKVSRRLVMFQVWFMRNSATQTLQAYNERLGRPANKIRNGVVAKTKFILNSSKWTDYFAELRVALKNEKCIDQLLRFAVYNSMQMGYHRGGRQIAKVRSPSIRVTAERYEQQKYVISADRKLNSSVIRVGNAGSNVVRGWNMGTIKSSKQVKPIRPVRPIVIEAPQQKSETVVVDKSKLSKSQKKRLRKRLAKERRKAQQQPPSK